MTARFDPAVADLRWQKRWDDERCFIADSASAKPKSYVLEMFPYPSGRIHMGHVRNYTMGDVLARYRRMRGFEVLHPMGWDAFGMPAENAAMERGVHPEGWTRENIAAMREQLKRLGFALDWSRELATCDPEYYGHEQALFLDLYEAGLVYRKESEVNWDPVDMTVLANEQVIDGKGWRSGAVVERRKLAQWFLKITDFADELLDGLKGLDQWPDKVRLMQENWIGRSRGLEFGFQMAPPKSSDVLNWQQPIDVFTTRPDTIFGASFVAISAGHPFAQALAASEPAVAAFLAECKKGGTTAAEIETTEKRGIDTRTEVIHPLDPDRRLPVYIANFVLMDYGTGAIFGVPAHDQRDFEFATQYQLPINRVVAPSVQQADEPVGEEADNEPGVAVNSRFLDGLPTQEAAAEVIRRAEADGWGKGTTAYRLRDWGVSRQRYWGTPIPVIHCEACGVVPVPRDAAAGGAARRGELRAARQPARPGRRLAAGQMPGLRRRGAARNRHFRHLHQLELVFHPLRQPADRPAVRPRRGREPGCRSASISAASSMRFCTCSTRASGRARSSGSGGSASPSRSRDCSRKAWSPTRPIAPATAAGCAPTRSAATATTGCRSRAAAPVELGRVEKMSKSKRNTVDPQPIVERFGADAVRWFMLSDSPPERDLEWSEAGIEGAARFVQRVWRLSAPDSGAEGDDDGLRRKLHRTIAATGEAIEALQFNKAVAQLYELVSAIEKAKPSATRGEAVRCLVRLIAPMAPHLAEECWQALGRKGMVADAEWPGFDEALLVDDQVTLAIQVNGKLRDTISAPRGLSRPDAEALALASDKVQRQLGGAAPRKVIVVPDRLVNIVA